MKHVIRLIAAAGCIVLAAAAVSSPISAYAFTLRDDVPMPESAWLLVDDAAAPVFAESAPMMIALTFDDGPHKTYTAQLLDYLKRENIRATFFVIGTRAKKNESLIARMAMEGHQIGNHGYDHTSFTKLTDAQINDQLRKTADIIEHATGARPTMIRPPYGSTNERVLAVLNMPCILWSVDPRDWNTRSATEVYEHVVKRAKAGDIILLHDIRKHTIEAVKLIVPALKAKGFLFVTVEELLMNLYGELDSVLYKRAK